MWLIALQGPVIAWGAHVDALQGEPLLVGKVGEACRLAGGWYLDLV